MTVLETLTTAYSAVTCLIDDSDTTDTIFTMLTTTATSSLGGNPVVNVQIQAMDKYVDSLSTEQLAQFDEALSQKETEIDLGDGKKAIISEEEVLTPKTLKKI